MVILDEEKCFDHLRREPVGRLGFVDHGEPVILPVNYAVAGRSIVLRTGQGSKLAVALMAQPVCLEIDGWDELGKQQAALRSQVHAKAEDRELILEVVG